MAQTENPASDLDVKAKSPHSLSYRSATSSVEAQTSNNNTYTTATKIEGGSVDNDKSAETGGHGDTPITVNWDGPDDPANPLNWPHGRKLFIIFLISAVTFNVSLAATIFAPGVPKLMHEFNSTSTSLSSFVVSAYIVSFILGPLVFAPLSELYGRSIVMRTSNVTFLIFTIICAVSQNMPMFIVFRLLQGLSGSVPIVLGAGIISDLMVAEHRGKALSGWQLGPLLGPVLGPVIGGYMAENVGWRWVFWLVAILAAIFTAVNFFVPETYAMTLLGRKAARLAKETGANYVAPGSDGRTPGQLFRKAIIRPIKMLFLSPIVMLLCLETSMVYGYLYLLFTTFTFVFRDQYGFKSGAAGLAYMGLGVGFLLGLFSTGVASDRMAKKKAAGSPMKPEHRLPPLLFGTVLVPIGLFWYGWTAQYKVHWIAPIIGTSFVGLGILFVFMPVQSYLIDAFTVYAASAIAANTVLRSIIGAVLPLAGQPMYNALGLGWGNSLLAFIALATVPFTYLLMKNGEYIRTHPRFQIDL
ncbi:polyamine transporter 1, partial [Metarhizium majus ARSEF 297]